MCFKLMQDSGCWGMAFECSASCLLAIHVVGRIGTKVIDLDS